MGKRVGGIIFVKVDGHQYSAKGAWEYNLGVPKREAVIGHDGYHGYKALPQEAYISGEITDNADLNLRRDLLEVENATVTLELYNGKIVMLQNADFTGAGTGQTEEGNIAVRFTGEAAKEIR